MKKIILISVLAALSFNMFGQKISGGLVVSPMLSWMKPTVTKEIINENPKFGFNFGLVGDLNFSDNFSFSTGILVDNFGGKLKYNDSIPEFNVDLGSKDSTYSLTRSAIVTYNLQYVELPIAIKGKTNEIGYMTYFIQAGINPMFKWKAKGDVSQANIDASDISKEVKGFVLGYHIGGGFEYSLGGNTKLLVALIYNNGLTDVTKTKTYIDKDNISTDTVILNNIALRAGILF